MAVPRPILLALLGALLLVATFMAAATTRNASSEKVAQPSGSAHAPAQPAASNGLAPADALKAIASPGNPINSGRFSVRLSGQELGGSRERGVFVAKGVFQEGAKGKLPSFDVGVATLQDGRSKATHVRSTGDEAYVFNGSTARPLGVKGTERLADERSKLAGGGQPQSPSGEQPAPPPQIDPSSWLTNVKQEPTVKVDGVDATHVSAAIDPARVATSFSAFAGSLGGQDGAQPAAAPKALERSVRRAFKSAEVDAYVGTQDRIMRRLRIAVTGAVPNQLRDKGESARWRVVLDVKLSQVNRPQRISEPTKIGRRAAGSPELLTLAALAVDSPASLSQTTAGILRTTAAPAQSTRTPRAVQRAIKAKQKVVIFFHQERGVDDPLIADAVSELKGRSSARVFSDTISNAASYGQLLSSVGVSRAPSIVIVGKSGKARLVEGYIDPDALAQEVADAR